MEGISSISQQQKKIFEGTSDKERRSLKIAFACKRE
jgi:hypothetical protein